MSNAGTLVAPPRKSKSTSRSSDPPKPTVNPGDKASRDNRPQLNIRLDAERRAELDQVATDLGLETAGDLVRMMIRQFLPYYRKKADLARQGVPPNDL